jgi:hypothetical protein
LHVIGETEWMQNWRSGMDLLQPNLLLGDSLKALIPSSGSRLSAGDSIPFPTANFASGSRRRPHQATHQREVEIQEHDVGQECSGFGHGLKPIGRFPDDEQMPMLRQAEANALAHDGMIIHYQYFGAISHLLLAIVG